MLSGSCGGDFVINLHNLLHNDSWGGGGDGDGDEMLRSKSWEYHTGQTSRSLSVLGKENPLRKTLHVVLNIFNFKCGKPKSKPFCSNGANILNTK